MEEVKGSLVEASWALLWDFYMPCMGPCVLPNLVDLLCQTILANRPTDRENKLMVTKGGRRWGGIN